MDTILSRFFRVGAFLCILCTLSFGQSQVAGDRTFLGKVDTSQATQTKPFRVVSSLPVSCSPNEWVVLTGTPNTVYYCSASSAWTQYTTASTAVTVTGAPGVQYAATTGSATGIAAAAAACTANPSCSIIIPPTYSLNDLPSGFMIDPNQPTASNLPSYAIVHDQRYGGMEMGNNFKGYSFGLINSPNAWQFNMYQNFGPQFIFTPHNVLMNSFDGGHNIENDNLNIFDKSTYASAMFTNYSWTPGQHEGLNSTLKNFSVGDTLGLANYVFCAGGFVSPRDEGCEAQDNQVFMQNVEYSGPLTGSASTGATSLIVAPTAGALTQGAKRFLVDVTKVTTGTLSAVNYTSTNSLQTVTGTGFTASTVVGTLGTNVVNVGVPTTITGSTYTVGSISGISVGSVVNLSDGDNFESVAVTALTSNSWTATFYDVHQSNSTFGIGGKAGSVLSLNADEATNQDLIQSVHGIPSTLHFAWPVVYSTTTTLYLHVAAGGGYGQYQTQFNATSVATGTLGTGGTGYVVGDVLTAVQTSASGAQWIVTSIGTNGVVTGIALKYYGLGYSIASGLATTGGTGTGATINITALNNGYKLYPAALVNSVQTAGVVSNSLTLAANTVAWASGDVVAEFIHPAANYRMGNNVVEAYTPGFPNYSQGWGMIFDQPLQGNESLLSLAMSWDRRHYVGHGGMLTPPRGITISAPTDYGLTFSEPSHHWTFGVNCIDGCNSIANIIGAQNASFYDVLQYDQSAKHWNLTVNANSSAYVFDTNYFGLPNGQHLASLAGSTTKVSTENGTFTVGHLLTKDSLGNIVDGGAVPTGGGSSNSSAPSSVHSATASGTPTYGTGLFNQGLTAVTDANYLAVPSGAFVSTTGQYAMEFRFKTTNSSNIMVAISTSNEGWLGLVGGQCAFAGPATGSTIKGDDANGPVANGNWHTCAASISNSGSTASVALFTDGVAGSVWTGSTLSSFSDSGVIGRVINSTGFSFQGSIDEVALWGLAKYTASYTVPSAAYTGSEQGLTALYHLDGNGTDSVSLNTSSSSGTGTASFATLTGAPADNAALAAALAGKQNVGTGTSGDAVSLRGITITTTTPVDGQTPMFNATTSQIVWVTTSRISSGNGVEVTTGSTPQVNIKMGMRTVLAAATSDTLLTTDGGGFVLYKNTAAISVALPQPGLNGNFTSGYPITVRAASSSGGLTLVPNNSTIGDSLSSIPVYPGHACQLIPDGTNWQLGVCN